MEPPADAFPPWRQCAPARVIKADGVIPGQSSAIAVHLQHRDWPGVRFTVWVDAELNLTGTAVGPLRWIEESAPGYIRYLPDDQPVSGLVLSATELRSIPWGTLHAFAATKARDVYGFLSVPAPTSTWAQTVAKGQQRRPGRKGHGDEHYARVAHEYVELLQQGERFPIRVMSGRWNEPEKYVREQVSRCRPRTHGMLTDAPKRGVAGGELTEKAISVLRSASMTSSATSSISEASARASAARASRCSAWGLRGFTGRPRR